MQLGVLLRFAAAFVAATGIAGCDSHRNWDEGTLFKAAEDAIFQRNLDELAAILEVGIDVNKHPRIDPDGLPIKLLHAACYIGDPAIVEMLLRSGADPKLRDEFGLHPAEGAIESGNLEVLELLRLHHSEWPEELFELQDFALLFLSKHQVGAAYREVSINIDGEPAPFEIRQAFLNALPNANVEESDLRLVIEMEKVSSDTYRYYIYFDPGRPLSREFQTGTIERKFGFWIGTPGTSGRGEPSSRGSR